MKVLIDYFDSDGDDMIVIVNSKSVEDCRKMVIEQFRQDQSFVKNSGYIKLTETSKEIFMSMPTFFDLNAWIEKRTVK